MVALEEHLGEIVAHFEIERSDFPATVPSPDPTLARAGYEDAASLGVTLDTACNDALECTLQALKGEAEPANMLPSALASLVFLAAPQPQKLRDDET